MRSQFDKQLDVLNVELTYMGSLCEKAIDCIGKGLTQKSLEPVREVFQLEDTINQKEREIESICLKLLLQQQPVAKDLRLISATLKMITDMERIGDQASDIASIILQYETIEFHFLDSLQKMANATITMVNECVEAYVKKDLDLANRVILQDDDVDQHFSNMKSKLTELIHQKENIDDILNVLMIAKYFEKISDHACNIAEWVKYCQTGKHEKEG